MLQFIFGLLFGLSIIPILLITLICTFPLTVQKGKKQHSKLSPPQHHLRLHTLLPSSTPHTDSPTPPTSTLHHQTIETVLQDLSQRAPQGESVDWFNIFILFGYTTVKQILSQADQVLLRQLTVSKSKSLPPTGTYDTSQFSNHPLSNPHSPGSSTILPILNRVVLEAIQDIPFLGPVRLTYLDFRSIIPQLHRIQIIQYNASTNTLIFDIEFSLATDSTIEVDLAVNLQHADLLIASMPAQAALANVFVQLNARVAVDLDFSSYSKLPSTSPIPTTPASKHKVIDHEGKYDKVSDDIEASQQPPQQQHINNSTQEPHDDTVNTPSISLTLLEPPILRFDLASSIGATAVLSNLPYVHALIHKAMMMGLSSTLVQPNIQSIPIPTSISSNISQLLVDLATGQKKL